MAKKLLKPRIKKVTETFVGQQLATPGAQQRHDSIVQQLREAAREEIELLEQSERLTKDDLAVVINARADDLIFTNDEV